MSRVVFCIYRMFIGPALQFLSLIFLGPGFGCRFEPTCSHYAEQAISTHGWGKGGFLALRRIARCRPGGPVGVPGDTRSSFDPVPPLH